MATLPKILKSYGVDKIIAYHQLPPNKERQILFGWEERNDLPVNQDLVLCRPTSGYDGEITISTKDDYSSYFKAVVGCELAEFLKDHSLPRFDSLKIEKDFAVSMANLLTTGEAFSWSGANKTLEFLIIPEKIS